MRVKRQILSGLAAVFGLLFALMLAQPTLAALPAKPQYNFYDEANVLNEKTKKLVSDKNLYYTNRKAKPQVVLAVVKSTDGDEIDSYAPDLFQKWGIGQTGKDNGILILYAVNGGARNVRIEVGYGMESVITDSIAGRILNNNKANLKSTDTAKINQGLQKTFNSVTSLVDAHYGYKGDKNNLSAAEVEKLKNGQTVSKRWMKAIGLIVAVLVVVFIILSSGNNGGGGSGPGSGNRRRGGLPWWIWAGSGSSGSSWGGGSSGSSGGGFGGFGGFSGGGGSSGGGGASI
ncbi:TPM domain-containing protein [Agrilactobacillus yilanensis]|uniref:TPM domain-containing protein n=1 Tax=Agrilactobacillus yilanensis TaxID=2485997 RepID=A0ABW4J4F3_9LACO|nr:TPM domain-containing protein [Agrilactobacillus yilanensis]